MWNDVVQKPYQKFDFRFMFFIVFFKLIFCNFVSKEGCGIKQFHDAFLSTSLREVGYGPGKIRNCKLLQRYPWRDNIWWAYQITNQLYSYTYTYWHSAYRFLMLSAKIDKWCHLLTWNGLPWWKFQSHHLLEL